MPKAFIAGATGYTGREVVRALVERRVETTAHVRPDSPRLAEWRERFGKLGAQTDTTPWEADAMRDTIARLRPDLIFSLLGTTRVRGREAAHRGGAAETYETVDYGLTVLLLRAAVACGTRPKFVYLSSIGVSGETSNRYLSARWRAEVEVRASGLPFVIVRPSFITGPDRDEFRFGERVTAVAVDAALGAAARLGARRLGDRYRSTTNRILAEAMVRFALDPTITAATVESEDLRARG